MAVSAEQMSRDDLVILQRKVRTPWRDAWRQLLKNKMSVASAIFIIFLILIAIFADYVNPFRLQGYWPLLVAENNTPFAKQLDQSKREDVAQYPRVPPMGVYKPTGDA
ncbi:MAG: hypothetical protein ACP5SI_09305, partial [Chloroflexia bacterium]